MIIVMAQKKNMRGQLQAKTHLDFQFGPGVDIHLVTHIGELLSITLSFPKLVDHVMAFTWLLSCFTFQLHSITPASLSLHQGNV